MNRKLLALASLGLMAAAAHGASLLSTGFESPFTVGAINGQQGWSTFTSGTGNSAVISTAKPYAGANSLLVTAGANGYSDPYHAISYTGNTATAATKVLTFSTQIYVNSVTGTTATEGAAGLDLYDSTYSPNAGALIGSSTGTLYIGIDPNDGVNDPGYYSFVGLPTATLNAWNTLSVVLDFSTSTPTYLVGLNGSYYDFTGFSDFTGATTISEADLEVYGGTTAAASAYFDNASVVSSSPVPEPSAFAALSLGAMAVLRRRKRA